MRPDTACQQLSAAGSPLSGWQRPASAAMAMPGTLVDTPGSTPNARALRRTERDTDSHADVSEEGGYERPDQVGRKL